MTVQAGREPIRYAKVLVCDDHPIVRDALVAVLGTSPDIEVVGAVSSYEESLEFLARTAVDVAVLDVHLQGRSGLEIARHIRAQHPSCRILFLTAFVSDEVISEASRIGASDLMDKSSEPRDIIERVLDVAAGRSFLDQVRLADVFTRLDERGVLTLLSLGKTDRQIMELIAEGKADKQISEEVYLSSQTVRNRISRLLSLLGRDNRTQLALLLNSVDEVARPVD
ncbi:MAG: response regulator [Ilumatobacteraceae bacterium]